MTTPEAVATVVHTPLYHRTRKEVEELWKTLRARIDPWLFGFGPHGKLDLRSADGKPITCGGGSFEGSPQQVFWGGYIEPFIEAGVIKTLDHITDRCLAAGINPEQPLHEAGTLLKRTVESVYRLMADVDQRLRGKGYPQSVSQRDTTHYVERMQRFVDNQLESAVFIALSTFRSRQPTPVTSESQSVSLLDRLISQLKNRWPIAVGGLLVLAIVMIGSVTDALRSILDFFSALFQRQSK